MSPKLSLFEQD